MTRRDEEFFVMKMADYFKANLNTKIAAINAEKNDGITLTSVDSSAYYFMTFGQTMPLYDPVVLFGVEPEEGATNDGESSEIMSLVVEMVVNSKLTPNSETLFKTLARYRRAIKEVIRDGIRNSKIPAGDLTNLPNAAFTAGKDEQFFVLGVGIKFQFVT